MNSETSPTAQPGSAQGPEAQTGASIQPAPATVRVVAVGNAAANVLELLIHRGVPSSACITIDTDPACIARSGAGEKLTLEVPALAGAFGTGGDPEKGAEAAEAQSSRISELCRGARVIIVLAGLGGGLGTGAAPVVVRLAKSTGALTMAFGIMPFVCEGNMRRKLAEAGLQGLGEAADLVVSFANERATALAGEATTLLDTFKTANDLLATSCRAAFHAFSGGTVMGLPFPDLCGLLSDRTSQCTMLAAESAAQDRVAEVIEKLLKNPSLDASSPLSDAHAVAVFVMGGPSLAMLDVNRVVDRLGRECGTATLMMGAAIEPALDGTLMVGLLAGRNEPARVESRSEAPSQSSRMQNPIGDIQSTSGRRPASRLLPPPPEISQERAMEIRDLQAGRKRKNSPRMRQTQLPLDIVSKGRFDKAEPTIHKGEDLDVPTYVRRGIALN